MPVKTVPAKANGKSADAFARVMEAGKQLSLLAGLEDLYPNIAGQAMILLNADAAHVFLSRDNVLEIAGAAGLSELRGKSAPMERSLSGWVARMGEMIILPDIEKAAASWEKEFFKAAGFRAHLFLPVDWAGSGLAVLGLHARAQRRWRARETAMAKAFADFVAVALENARLYREAEDRAKTLAELNRKLEEAVHVKSRFLATVSHELRSPLFVITGYASLIAEQVLGPLPAELSDAAAKIVRQANGLSARITEILEISQLDAGTVIFHHDSFDLAEFLDEVSQQMGNLIGDKPIIFEGRYSDEPFVVVTDRPRLAQILGHILDNAAKFTQQGKIVLHAAPNRDGVEIIVEDSGIGIDPEYQKIIFDDFRQVEEEDNRRYEGMGLGFHLSRRMLELLGGKISLESELGKGSRFRLWLPRGGSARTCENQT
ncbi:MAG: HAMP domain-containing histidine kinase [Deltaproteobacteria bacterium]|nr:HAMP domain-containing histidine kinase [Deltaproteobacteria bacterium]